MIGLAYRFVVWARHDEPHALEVVVHHTSEDTQPDDAVVAFCPYERETAERQRQIVEHIVLVFLVDESRNLSEVILRVELWGSHIQFHLSALYAVLFIPVFKGEVELTWGVEEIYRTNVPSRLDL